MLVDCRTLNRALNVVFIPSVSGGLGHVTRTVKLARALERADPSLRISYVLDELGLRELNVEAIRRTGYPFRIVPNPVHHERTEKIRAVLGDADVVIEDTNRRLIAYRRILPRLRVWVSIPMLPIWDELFMDWPLLEHADHILYTYPPVMGIPEELEPFRDRLTVTGPILDPEEKPDRVAARHRLTLADDERSIVYAPRGFPFGRRFGRHVLTGVVGGFMRLRQRRPELRLLLTAVPEVRAVQPARLPSLDRIDGVIVKGMVAPEEARDDLAAAALAIVEGTSTLFDAALHRTPVLMVPGPIHETMLEGRWVGQHNAGVVVGAQHVTPTNMARQMQAALEPEAATARSAHLHDLVGTGGRDIAVEVIRRLFAKKVPR